MKRQVRLVQLVGAASIIGLLVFVDILGSNRTRQEAPPTQAVLDRPIDEAAEMAFVPNAGQWDKSVLFSAATSAASLKVTDDGFAIDLRKIAENIDQASDPVVQQMSRTFDVTETTVNFAFVGKNVDARALPKDRVQGVESFFLDPDPTTWRTNLPRYGSVDYVGLYDGIDARIYSRDGHPEYDVVAAPGADLASVEIAVDGAQSVTIDSDGGLVVTTPLGLVRQPAPTAFVLGASGSREPVACDFVRRGHDSYGYSAPAWDGKATLEIDPGLIYGSTFGQEIFSVAVDSTGGIFIAAVWTGWVAKIDPTKPAGQQVVWSASFGGVYNMFDMAVGLNGTGDADGPLHGRDSDDGRSL